MDERLPVRQIVAALPMPTVVIDRNERIVAQNDAASELLGTGVEGRHFVTALRQPALVEAVENCLAGALVPNATYLTTEAGRDVTYDVSLKRTEGSGDVVLSFLDVTQVTHAGQMRRDFVANVSHELRTPLTSLMGFIETLAGPARDDPEARQRFLAIMADEAGRMNRLVGDLLSLSRVEAEERVRPTDQVNLAHVLQTTLRNLAPLAIESDVLFQTDLPSEPLPVWGDADQLVQVFTNLIENAIKYGGPDKSVEVAAATIARDPTLRVPTIRVTVRDHGPGIDSRYLPRLTERFYRADNHRSRALGGTGLGLAIVKHILNRHRGRLSISSEPGQGASFCVALPMDAEPDAH